MKLGSLRQSPRFGCHKTPTFSNLTELVIESHHKDQLSDWDSLPVLFNNCQQLHTLVFLVTNSRLTHQARNTCGNVCRCEGVEVTNHSCLETSLVKILKIYDFGQAALDMDSFVAMVRHFLVTMPHLERFMVYCDGNARLAWIYISRKIQEISRKASPI
ncbi:hypothetical protein IGI04_037682 [Brassica rapa subsp. trilocularis]|uniref:FBD domain-containing protein n=1 Tax=Brassica rapa subsp. trilocularis TaxID=1813537 RepID=A0ABQ7LI45_BRACM|nr:hypothetical protein IGI04_037682 [Brassica rapa subsp. trilocularis]